MKKSRKQKRRLQRVLVITSACIVALILILSFAGSLYLDHYLKKDIIKQKITHHIVSIEDARVNYFKSVITLKNVGIHPDTQWLHQTPADSLAYFPLFDLDALEIIIFRPAIFKLLISKTLSFSEVRIKNPVIRIIYPDKDKKHDIKKCENDTSHSDSIKQDSAKIRNLEIRRMSIVDGRFAFTEHGAAENIISLKQFSIMLTGLSFDPGDLSNLMDALELKEMSCRIQDAYVNLPGGFYDISFRKMNASWQDKIITIDTLNLIPQYDKPTFGKQFGHQVDRFELTAGRIILVDIDEKMLFNEKGIKMKEIEIDGLNADIYRDKRVARDTSIYPLLPHQALVRTSTPVHIEKVKVSDGHINYEEYEEGADEPGQIFLTEFNMDVQHITNSPEAIADSVVMEAYASFRLMDKGLLQIRLDFPLDHRNGEFTFKGDVRSMDLKAFNSMLEPNAKLSIRSGIMDEMTFDAVADAESSHGTVKFLYHDLKLLLFKNKERENREVINRFITRLANLAIHSSNPLRNGKTRIALVDYERDKHKGVINLILKTQMEGIVNTAVPGDRDIEKVRED